MPALRIFLQLSLQFCIMNQYRQVHRVTTRWAHDLLQGLIASGTSIARYTGLLLGRRTILHGIANNSLSVLQGGRTMLHGITNNSLKVDCFRNQYRRVRRVTATVLHGITNTRTCIDGYAGLLLGGHTILSGIANSSPRVDCFRNQYRRVHRVMASWAYHFAWHS